MVAVVTMFQPLIVKRVIDEGIVRGDMTFTIWGASACLTLSFLSYLLSGAQAITTSSAVHKMIRDLRSQLIRHVLRLSASWHDSQISGALATRATSDFDNLSESLNQGVLSSVIDILVLFGCISGMFILSPKLAVVAVIILPIMTWLVIWFSKKLNAAMLASKRNLAILNGFTQEALASVSAVKLLNAEKSVSNRYNKLNVQYRDAQLENVFYDALMFATIDGISSITLGIALFMAIQWSGYADNLTPGLMVAFIQYIQQLFEPLKQLGTKMAMLQGAFTSIERIFGLMEKQEFVAGDRTMSWPSQVDVQFDQVSFAYTTSKSKTLSDISFRVPSGSSLAIIGSTGSGKSTIIKLLTKLYDGYSGSIRVAGTDIKDLDPEHTREQMGIVPQDLVLFEGSIEFNINLGSRNVSKQEIIRAAHLVGADRFINDLPGGLDFHVKENGSNLSHGQKQLIVFARALTKNPPIVILDEATSSIDPQSEALIQEATKRILKDRTVVVIAHRLETIRRCDNILVIEHGRLVEMGPPAELERRGGRYQNLLALLKDRNHEPI
jgi:ATP-binding cassette subfamily B multidrug efflux pump